MIATLKTGMGVSGHVGKDAIFEPNTTIKGISGSTVTLNKDAKLSGEYTAYFADRSLTNQHREIDMSEVVRNFLNRSDRDTDNQFTLQPFWLKDKNVHRYTLKKDQSSMTVVMNWTGGNKPVTFSEYDGIYNLSDLPATPTVTWTTDSQQNIYIPNSYQQTFHLNLWVNPGRTCRRSPSPTRSPSRTSSTSRSRRRGRGEGAAAARRPSCVPRLRRSTGRDSRGGMSLQP